MHSEPAGVREPSGIARTIQEERAKGSTKAGERATRQEPGCASHTPGEYQPRRASHALSNPEVMRATPQEASQIQGAHHSASASHTHREHQVMGAATRYERTNHSERATSEPTRTSAPKQTSAKITGFRVLKRHSRFALTFPAASTILIL